MKKFENNVNQSKSLSNLKWKQISTKWIRQAVQSESDKLFKVKKWNQNNFIKIVFKNSFHAHVKKCMYFKKLVRK